MNPNYNDITIPMVLLYETDLINCKEAQICKKTLETHNWQHTFIGEGMKWNGFGDKIMGCYNFLNTLKDDKMVVLSDSRDVFCLQKPTFFIDQIKDIVENKIIISAEMFLCGHLNWNEEQISKVLEKNVNYFWQGVPLSEYWNFHNITSLPFRKYLNAGLIIGKAKNLRIALKWMIDNNINDDQLGLSMYTNKFPNLVHLDYEATFLHTLTSYVDGSLYDYNIQKLDALSFHELFGFSNYFLHIPGSNISKGQKYIYNIVYLLFHNGIIDKNMFEIYNITRTFPITNTYFETN